MKKTLFFLAAVLCISTCFARVHKITVSNFQFSPANTNAKVGDTILWVWQNGSHTTSSLTIPAGAKPWNAPMNSMHKRFGYIVTKTGVYNFQCNIHPTLMMGTIKVSAALDAGLSDLNLSTENARAVLNWNVQTNAGVSSFSVQRSTDGKNFTEISSVQPSALNNYKYTDEAALTTKYVYYQVVLTDKNGNTQLSNIQMFTNTQSASKLITSISPNPVSNPGHLMLQFNADADGKMRVQLFTQNGKLINETEMTATKGLNNGHLHLGTLEPGSYYIICSLGNKTEKHIIFYQ
jgi:plastocyanin/uncharacterized protein YegP (UPF0339 family)